VSRGTLGRSGVEVSRIGLGSSYGLDAAGVEEAVERGVNYLYWGSTRRDSFGRGITAAARKGREKLVVVVQSYSRAGTVLRLSLRRALKQLGLDYADFLLLGWWNQPPPRRILDAARAAVDAGEARHVMISCHHRPTFRLLAADPAYGALMLRSNAAHPGAEKDVFPALPPREARPGIVAYTATRWGTLLRPESMPPGEATPRASDCYRFALTDPNVDMVIAGPRDRAELDEALVALERGPMTADEIAWMKRVGAHVRAKGPTGNAGVGILDRFTRGSG
jgi:aryl-alcohol dehydrogenase-like predicted oxidoreductase